MRRLLALVLSAALLCTPVLAAGETVTDPDAPSLGIYLQREFYFHPATRYTTLSGSVEHMAALRPDGSLWTWGSNQYGQLGLGTDRGSYNAPISVMDNVTWAKASDNATLAIKSDGSLWGFGQLSPIVGSRTPSPTRLADSARAAAVGHGYLAVVTGDNRLLGYDEQGIASTPVTYATGAFVDVAICPGTGVYGTVSSSNSIKDLVDTVASAGDALVPYIVYGLTESGVLTRYFMASSKLYTEAVAQNVSAIRADVSANDTTLYYITADGTLYSMAGSDPNTLAVQERSTDVAQVSGSGGQIYVTKTDGSLWYLTRSQKLADGKTALAGVGNCGALALDAEGRLAPVDVPGSSYHLEEVFSWTGDLPSSFTLPNKEEPFYSKAIEIVGDATDDYEKARRISHWMDQNLKYDRTLQNHSALALLETGVGVCDAYSGLTACFYRAVGIPVTFSSYPPSDVSNGHEWNRALIDGVVTFVDNTHHIFDYSLSLEGGRGVYSSGTNCSAWALPTVRAASSVGLTVFNSGGDFTAPISRERFCSLARSFAVRVSGKDMTALLSEKGLGLGTSPFGDTQNEDVIAMYRLGVVKGKGDGSSFDPNGNITRQEAALILRSLATALGSEVSAPAAQFADSAMVAGWARPGVDFVADRGIMTGRPEGFAPTANISVEEAIVTFHKYFTTQYRNEKGGTPT